MGDAKARQDGLLALVIVGGFLGSGKSTWLRHQLFVRRFARVHILVNEAAETSVDDLLLGRADRLDVLTGGCACCTGRDALRAALHKICDAESGPQAGSIDTIVLETSGLADPAAIVRAIMDDPVLVRRIVLSRTIVLVDGVEGANQLAQEGLARAQAEAADEIVVTKAHEADHQNLSRLAATLRLRAPDATLSFSDFGVEVQIATRPDAPPFDLGVTSEAAEPIRAHRLNVDTAGGWGALSAWLSALLFVRGESIVRVKGAIRTPAGMLLLQSVRRLVQPPEILPEPVDQPQAAHDDFIVLIGRGIDQDRLQDSWDRLVLDRNFDPYAVVPHGVV